MRLEVHSGCPWLTRIPYGHVTTRAAADYETWISWQESNAQHACIVLSECA